MSVCKKMRASLRCCLTNMRTRIVSGIKLARRKEMVSLPPEKICSLTWKEKTQISIVSLNLSEKKNTYQFYLFSLVLHLSRDV